MTDAHEIMSLGELSRRLSEVRRGEAHLKMNLPVDSSYNQVLRLRDILAYTGIPYPWVRRQFPEMYRFEFSQAPRPEPKGKDKPADKLEIAERQTALSRFFYGWDQGTLVKARVGDEWRICNRHASLHAHPAPSPPAAPRKVITMRIDRETLGLRFK